MSDFGTLPSKVLKILLLIFVEIKICVFFIGIQYIPVRVSGAGLTKAIPEVRNTFTLETHIRSGVRYGLNSHGFGFEEENVGDDVHYIPNAGAEGTLTISVTFDNENILGSPFQVNIP